MLRVGLILVHRGKVNLDNLTLLPWDSGFQHSSYGILLRLTPREVRVF